MIPATMYGLRWPIWWVRMRGKFRLKFGECPWCYSSPPNPWCPVCEGDRRYGPKLSDSKREQWGHKFNWCIGGMP